MTYILLNLDHQNDLELPYEGTTLDVIYDYQSWYLKEYCYPIVLHLYETKISAIKCKCITQTFYTRKHLYKGQIQPCDT